MSGAQAGIKAPPPDVVIDVHGLQIDNPLAWEDRLNALPGVVTNGVFARQKASLALVASQQGVRTLR